MKRQFNQSILVAFCATLISFSTISADEATPFPEVIPVELENNIEEFPLVETDEEEMIECGLEVVGNKYANDDYYLQRIHRDGYYSLVAISSDGAVVQLQDASKWDVQSDGRKKVLYWAKDHVIFIKPCISWFSNYSYVLHNRTLDEAVQVNLNTPPLPMGANTFRILNIEPNQRLVLLSDNTIWQVGADDQFSSWKIGDRLLVGVNNYWRTEKYPQTLINIEFKKDRPYAPAIFYGYPR